MRLREKFFRLLAVLITRHSGRILVVCALMTIAMMVAAGRLSMKTQFADMMPKDIPQINEYMEIIEDYQSDVTVMITLESLDKDTKLMRAAADELAAKLEAISIVKPDEGAKLSFGQKLALANGERPETVPYDTLNLVRRIDYKLDNEFIAEHGLIIQKPVDLENSLDMFGSLALPELIENINDNFEKEYIEDSDNLTSLDGEAQAVQGLEGMRRFLQSIEHYIDKGDSAAAAEAVADFIVGPQYFVSPDNTVLLMMLQPAVSFNEFEDLMYLGYRIDDSLAVVQEKYPGLAIGRTGAMMMQIDENNAMIDDFGWPSLIVLGLILVLLIGSFRTWRNPFLSIFTLVVGIIWTSGILALVLHYLNMASAGFGIVLVGLGIDFGIHFISGFRDGREQGMSVEDSVFYMYQRVGAGVVTGALTTAIVFFSLPLTRFEAYAEMGIAMGTGIVVVLIAQMVMLPALIVWDNKGYSVVARFLRAVKLGALVTAWNGLWGLVFSLFRLPVFMWISRPLQFGFLEASGRLISRLPVAIGALVVAIVLVILSIQAGRSMEWEYDFMKLQPQGTPSQIAQDKILDKFEFSPDFAMVKADDVEDCRRLVEEFKKIGNRTGLIGSVDAITEFLPEEETQRENAETIAAFRDRLSIIALPDAMSQEDLAKLDRELIRLHQNIVEIGEMSIMSQGVKNKIIRKCDQIVGAKDEDSYVLALARKVSGVSEDTMVMSEYQRIAADVLKHKLLTMTSTDVVTLDRLPEDIRKRYVNPQNDDLLINVYPKGYIWEEKGLHKFNEQTHKVTPRITGMPAIIQLMMEMMAEKGRLAITFGSVAILAFLLIDFRSFKYTVLAAVPLAVGTVWMLGLMAATGMKLSFMNYMALPLIIGIGIDDGVHVLHRYRIEGPGTIPLVLKFTGRAILLTSLTTMLGFGAMGLASHQGMAAFGRTLFYGVGACFVSSAYVLPAIITLWERVLYSKKTEISNR